MCFFGVKVFFTPFGGNRFETKVLITFPPLGYHEVGEISMYDSAKSGMSRLFRYFFMIFESRK